MEQVDEDWLGVLQFPSNQQKSQQARPSYWMSSPRSLATTSRVHNFTFGTGSEIWINELAPSIACASKEVVIVTCFWARSDSLIALNGALLQLSARALRENTTIKVRICFSSCSFLQKVLHTRSLKGQHYPSTVWQSQLGLPAPTDLGGLDLEVKSVFVLPFSVMHPKFVLIDRQRVFLPSCNVSWEEWFEGCIECSGDVVDRFVEFWKQFWANDHDRQDEYSDMSENSQNAGDDGEPSMEGLAPAIPCNFLPSPHSVNPHFTLPWLPCNQPPPTPLNIYLLTLFARAEHCIRIQTPNLTSPPVISALQDALCRGINVSILTSERLMTLEQLVTAGTTTSRCMKKMMNAHRNLLSRQGNINRRELEDGLLNRSIGKLQISYFTHHAGNQDGSNAVQSHLKLTMIDEKIVVFGSGNLDRASWFTSQELGVAFKSSDLVNNVAASLDTAMANRQKVVYNS
ncbi:Hypothetical protein R9X50_00430100 [Acrodontium crateriforme]|uniref:Phospholipase D-like domain-containing protein n=1 Tax=Acrodontium crateriforme TaxID=150365 RepID=A0AAQ3RAN2_9PEZI|nr:Hypothetical protein R9X50_00430100 [Acrodontium crateriforme]